MAGVLHLNEEEVIRRCQEGERDAYRFVVEWYGRLLFGTAYLMTRDRQHRDILVAAEEGAKSCSEATSKSSPIGAHGSSGHAGLSGMHVKWTLRWPKPEVLVPILRVRNDSNLSRRGWSD